MRRSRGLRCCSTRPLTNCKITHRQSKTSHTTIRYDTVYACILFISSSVADSMSKVHQCPIVRQFWHFFLTLKETDVFYSCFHYIKGVFFYEGRNETQNTHTWFRRRSSGVRTKLGRGKWRTRYVTHSRLSKRHPFCFSFTPLKQFVWGIKWINN